MLKLQIEVERLGRGPIEIDETVMPAELGIENDHEFILRRPIALHLRARQAGHESVIVDGSFTLTAETECVRCLEPLVFPVTKSFTFAYIRRPDGARAVPEDEDNDNLFFDGDIIHPEDALREEMMLSLPYLPNCETQASRSCQPLPTVFGEESPQPVKPQAAQAVPAPIMKGKKNSADWRDQIAKVKEQIDQQKKN